MHWVCLKFTIHKIGVSSAMDVTSEQIWLSAWYNLYSGFQPEFHAT